MTKCSISSTLLIAVCVSCGDSDQPRLFASAPLPPAGYLTTATPALYDTHAPGAYVEVTEARVRELLFLGASLIEDPYGTPWGVNFSIYSNRAEKLRLLLFDDPESSRATREYEMTRFGDVWNVFVEGVGVGQHYGFIAWGPNWHFTEEWYPGSVAGFVADVDNAGNRFNPNKLLFDPYCREFNRDHDWSKGSLGTGPYRAVPTYGAAMKCRVTRSRYAWSDAELAWHARTAPSNDAIIYEVHVKGFTANSASGARHYGTFRGFGEKADYLRELGVTAVELMPPFEKPLDGGYWGYNTIGFFAPEHSFAHGDEIGESIDEFKWMVEQLHAHGIEVILDVVFNHTGEGGLWREKIFISTDENPPWDLDPEEIASLYSFRGLDNASYYALPPNNAREYCDYTEVGNTMRTNNTPMERLIIDSLRYWVEEYHVDGFRFDLAPALGAVDQRYDWCPTSRDKQCPDSPSKGPGDSPGGCEGITWDPAGTMIQRVIDDPVLERRGTRIIAEPWGSWAYPVGDFSASTSRPGYGWGEWNGRFRDWWRKFVNLGWALNWFQDGADAGSVLTGTAMAYQWNGRKPYHSVNFVTCHDGMTMFDLVSYDTKVNGCSPLNPVCCTAPYSSFCDEAKNSGTNDNWSRNWGDETFKRQLMRNWFVAMMVSQGTPMLYGGDEWMRTQLGNNNTYTPEADNPYSWHDWGAWQSKDDRWRMYDFVRQAIRFRKERAYAFAPADYDTVLPDWRNASGAAMTTAGSARHVMMVYDEPGHSMLAIAINMEESAVPFTLPPGRSWARLLDTQQYFDTTDYLTQANQNPRSSGNIWLDAPEIVTQPTYGVQSRSIVVFEAE